MELAPGEDLAERIARGRVSVEEAVPLFVQIAEGLEAAHERGIVHRDLKPANVKVGGDGSVKILDFGLARWRPGGAAADASRSPTLTAAATARGEILGTAPYMSPEQARGEEAGRRSDVWSFGVVLWEALTGERPFGGETITDILASVVRDDPPWSELPGSVPAAMRRLLRRCLEKNPRDRLQAIGDARLELLDALTESR